jgi:ribosomal protein S12 methylthiotransferase
MSDTKPVFGMASPVKTRTLELVQALADLAEPFRCVGTFALCLSLPQLWMHLIPLMANGRVLPYLDVPFQHSHPDVLKRMKRPASGEKNLERIATVA